MHNSPGAPLAPKGENCFNIGQKGGVRANRRATICGRHACTSARLASCCASRRGLAGAALNVKCAESVKERRMQPSLDYAFPVPLHQPQVPASPESQPPRRFEQDPVDPPSCSFREPPTRCDTLELSAALRSDETSPILIPRFPPPPKQAAATFTQALTSPFKTSPLPAMPALRLGFP
jgi:hypothetical protein